MKRSVCTLVLLLSLAAGSGRVHADLYHDLGDDWSNEHNPNGPWSLNQGMTPLVLVHGLGNFDPSLATQVAWRASAMSDDPPLWFKADHPGGTLGNWQAGDIVTYCWDGNAAGQSNVTWTAGAQYSDTDVHLSGEVWLPRDITGSIWWHVSLNGTQLGYGTLDPLDPDDILLFDATVSSGDVLELELVPHDSQGDFVGVSLTIQDPSVVPVPGAALLGVLGLSYSGWRLRRRTP